MATVAPNSQQLRQRYEALELANEIRIRRAGLKQGLRDGDRRLEDVVREPEWFVFSVPVCELLGWAPRVGPTRVNRILRRADVWPLREVGRLTVRQRMRLVEQLSVRGVM